MLSLQRQKMKLCGAMPCERSDDVEHGQMITVARQESKIMKPVSCIKMMLPFVTEDNQVCVVRMCKLDVAQKTTKLCEKVLRSEAFLKDEQVWPVRKVESSKVEDASTNLFSSIKKGFQNTFKGKTTPREQNISSASEAEESVVDIDCLALPKKKVLI